MIDIDIISAKYITAWIYICIRDFYTNLFRNRVIWIIFWKRQQRHAKKRATNSKVAAINRTIVRHHPPPLARYLLDNYYFSPLTMGTFIMSIKGRLLPIFNIINDLYKIKILFDIILKQKDNSKEPLYSSVQCICWI